MTKLTNQMRNAIVDKLIVPGRVAREKALKDQENSLALRATKYRFGDDVFDRCRALPEGWVDFQQRISLYNCSLPSKRFMVKSTASFRHPHQITVPSTGYHLNLLNPAALPNAFRYAWQEPMFGAKLWNEVYAYFNSVIELYEATEDLKIKLTGGLSSYTTVERLSEGWPEAYAHLPQELLAPQPKYPVPAVPIADLNEMIEKFRRVA
jgi:putative DNA base modification enzyme with NMAD domain